jgi:hypothetical protein
MSDIEHPAPRRFGNGNALVTRELRRLLSFEALENAYDTLEIFARDQPDGSVRGNVGFFGGAPVGRARHAGFDARIRECRLSAVLSPSRATRLPLLRG